MPNTLAKRTYVCGTIQANRKDYYRSSPQNALLLLGDDFQTSVVDHVNAVVWMGVKRKNKVTL